MGAVFPPDRLLAAVDATWPPRRIEDRDGWRLRDGGGGGKRVSAATPVAEAPDLAQAEDAMQAMGQGPLFSVWPDLPGHEALDKALESQGYAIVDPVALYTAPVAALDDGRDETAKVIRSEEPIAVMREIWAAGGIGPARLDVMARATGPSLYLLGRAGDRPAGTAFVAVDGPIAMIHAIETAEPFRRQGVAERLLRAAASFAGHHGADILALAVTEANIPARALYDRLGMTIATRYHYRAKEE